MPANHHRVALIGCGRWGTHILRDLLALDCEVVVVTRTDASAVRAVQLGAASAGTTVAAVEAIDGIVVASPSTTHADIVRSLLRLDVPIFVEKPLTIDAAGAKEIVAAAGERVFVMDKWRYHPGIGTLTEIVRSGAVGEVSGLRTVRVGTGNPHPDADVTWHLLPHDLSIALEILGEIPAPTSAVAYREGGAVSGLLGHLRFADGRWMAAEVASNAAAHVRRIEILGSEGVAALADGWDEHVTITRSSLAGEQERTTVAAGGELPLLAELRSFVDHLNGGPPPRSSAAEGLAVVETIEGLRRMAGLNR